MCSSAIRDVCRATAGPRGAGQLEGGLPGPASFWAVKWRPWRRQKGRLCSSCLKARAGDRNGVGREGIAIKSNTEATQMQDKMPSWQVDLNAAGHHWRWEGERTGCEYCFPKGGVSENYSVLTLTRKTNNLSYAYFEALLHCGSQSLMSSMKRMPKAVAVINGGFLKRGRMGHFQT